ncbi:MAG: hypothetical protein KAH22_06665 [Thiotrichaceae bacterium]|nr:hypothetical protein [Thiotrichaceae bacterium]
MSIRQIHISNDKERDSHVGFKGYPAIRRAIKSDPNGNPTLNKKIIKGTSANSLEGLKVSLGEDIDKIADAIIQGDPEVNLEVTGKFLSSTPRVYVNEDLEVVYKVNKKEKVFNSKGELTTERDLKQLFSNVNSETPLKWSGKMMPIEKAYNKFVFTRSYQLQHDSGLTYDFLYGIASLLESKKSFMLIGSGNKGIAPAVFQDGGQAFRVFLEGRTEGDKYMLIMHLSNLELKALGV